MRTTFDIAPMLGIKTSSSFSDSNSVGRCVHRRRLLPCFPACFSLLAFSWHYVCNSYICNGFYEVTMLRLLVTNQFSTDMNFLWWESVSKRNVVDIILPRWRENLHMYVFSYLFTLDMESLWLGFLHIFAMPTSSWLRGCLGYMTYFSSLGFLIENK